MIIGITGTLGAGKGAVVSYLVKKKGFTHHSVRDFLAEEMEKENIVINRDTMVVYANTLREKYGPGYLFEKLHHRAQGSVNHAVIESIRTVGEAEALKNAGGTLLAIDADQEKRYERIHGRGSALDHVSFKEFQEQERREMHSSDSHKQNIAKVMEMADVVIQNNGTLIELYQTLEKTITK